MMKKLIALAVLSAIGLSGCGSDSNSADAPSQPVQPAPAPQYDNFEVQVEPNAQFDGIVKVYLGRWYPCTVEHPEMCADNMPADYPLPTTGALTGGTYGQPQPDAASDRNNNKYYNSRTRDDSQYYMEVKASDIKAFAESSVRDDIFVPGQYSILDVMLYVSSVRDDFEVTLGEFNTELNTYNFTTSFDANGDGDFTDEGDYLNSDNWYGAFLYSGGDFQKASGIPVFEAMYERLDEFWVQPDMHIRFQPVTDNMKARVRAAQKAEVDRLNAAGGKVILPELRVDFGDGRGYQTLATDIEVKPYNLRPDVFQKDVITMADALMSAYDNHGVDIRFTFWPTVSTKANVGSYAAVQFEGQHAYGLFGWTVTSGENMHEGDFFYGPEWPNAVEVMNGMGPFAGKCAFLRDENGNLNPATAQECIDQWFAIFGGNNTHRMTDVGVMMTPKEFIGFSWLSSMETGWEITERNHAGDGKYPIYDINQAIAPLQESHFGYGIADCGLCHSIEETHNQGDSPVLPDNTEPYFCASCHGGNGAPMGHGETARCHWCHSNDKAMTNHGDASQLFKFDELQCQGASNEGLDISGQRGSCADRMRENPASKTEVHNAMDNGSTYDAYPDSKKLTRGNSDWHTSESFPDPYSCMTCHPNQ